MIKRWRCTSCGANKEYGAAEAIPKYCDCGSTACKIFYKTRDSFVDGPKYGVDGLMIENHRYSVSGAVLDEDLPAARKMHPGRDFKKFGHSWRPLIKSRADKIKYLREAGAYEY